MALTTIDHLHSHTSPHQAVAVRKNNGKTQLFLNYYKGVVTIRNGEAKFKERFKGKDEADLIQQLQQKKYQYEGVTVI